MNKDCSSVRAFGRLDRSARAVDARRVRRKERGARGCGHGAAKSRRRRRSRNTSLTPDQLEHLQDRAGGDGGVPSRGADHGDGGVRWRHVDAGARADLRTRDAHSRAAGCVGEARRGAGDGLVAGFRERGVGFSKGAGDGRADAARGHARFGAVQERRDRAARHGAGGDRCGERGGRSRCSAAGAAGARRRLGDARGAPRQQAGERRCRA